MGWRGRRAGGPALAARAASRADRLIGPWRPTPPSGGSDAPGAAEPRPGLEALAPVTPPRDPWEAVTHRGQAAGLTVGPWSRPALRALALVVTACLAVAAWWWWSGRPREVVPAPTVLSSGVPVTGPAAVAGPTASSGPARASASVVVVDVTGLVVRPGLVSLPAGSRVADAVAAAGGVSRRHAADSVNLARVLVDGEQVVVGPGAAAAAAAAATPATPAPVNLNTADAAGLDGLPGVGPVLAARIVQWRLAHGPFRSVDELGEVSGIGEAILSELRPLVRV